VIFLSSFFFHFNERGKKKDFDNLFNKEKK